MTRGLVAVTIVTFNSSSFIRRCLEYLFQQDYKPFEVIVVDNASTDSTAAILGDFADRMRVLLNEKNVGFAAGQNQAMAHSDAEWILTLNPDVRLAPDFISHLVSAAEADPRIGSVCGKLLAMGPDFEVPRTPKLDSAGIYMTPNLRHFDRGSQMPDHGQYERFEYVFGGTGAACLYRREMIADISIEGEFFDSDFFAYREDADVAWRAQLLGWKCFYVPLAVAYHVRSVLPRNRRSVTAVINMHSVKNRWLLRIKNMTPGLYRRYWQPITLRDLIVIGGCLFYEFRSLEAFLLVVRACGRTWRKRQEIMRRRRASDAEIAAWFAFEPVGFPALVAASR